MMRFDGSRNRRQFPRVKAPIYFKNTRLFGPKIPVVDIGLGGMRVFSDDGFKVGEVLDIELYLPNRDSVDVTVRVVWLALLGQDAPAKFDVGLQILEVKDDRLHMLAQVLDGGELAPGLGPEGPRPTPPSLPPAA
jgi:hypothetical protein